MDGLSATARVVQASAPHYTMPLVWEEAMTAMQNLIDLLNLIPGWEQSYKGMMATQQLPTSQMQLNKPGCFRS